MRLMMRYRAALWSRHDGAGPQRALRGGPLPGPCRALFELRGVDLFLELHVIELRGDMDIRLRVFEFCLPTGTSKWGEGLGILILDVVSAGMDVVSDTIAERGSPRVGLGRQNFSPVWSPGQSLPAVAGGSLDCIFVNTSARLLRLDVLWRAQPPLRAPEIQRPRWTGPHFSLGYCVRSLTFGSCSSDRGVDRLLVSAHCLRPLLIAIL